MVLIKYFGVLISSVVFSALTMYSYMYLLNRISGNRINDLYRVLMVLLLYIVFCLTGIIAPATMILTLLPNILGTDWYKIAVGFIWIASIFVTWNLLVKRQKRLFAMRKGQQPACHHDQ